MYRITGRNERNVSLDDKVANVGMHARSAGLQFHVPPQETCAAHPKQTLRQYLWERWEALICEARNTQRWSQTQWIRHLNEKTTCCALPPKYGSVDYMPLPTNHSSL